MVRVRGSDQYVGVELAIEATWGTQPGAPTWMQVPIVEDSVHIEPAQVAKDQELGNVGAQAVYNFGAQAIVGSLTIYPRYNLKVFAVLLAHVFGGLEVRNADKLPSGISQAGTYSTHSFYPQTFQQSAAGSASGVAPGLSGRFWRSGPSQGGSIEQYNGIVPVRMRWNQPRDGRPTVTFDFIGIKHPTTHILAATGLSKAAIPASVGILQRDLSNRATHANLPSLSLQGLANASNPTALYALPISAFNFTLESNIEFAPPFLNKPDTPEKPGHVGPWTITGEIQAVLDTTWTTNTLHAMQAVGIARPLLRFRYASLQNADGAATLTNGETTVPYALDIYFKNLGLGNPRRGIERGGALEYTIPFEAAKTPTGFGYATTDTSLTAAILAQALVQLVVSDTDDGSGNFTSGAEGGNPGGGDQLELAP